MFCHGKRRLSANFWDSGDVRFCAIAALHTQKVSDPAREDARL
jgi:hypothetical protein